MSAVDVQQLRALVAAVVQPDDRRRVVAVRSDAPWTGPEVIDGVNQIRVVHCPSPLAVRAAMVDHGAPSGQDITAILTPCADRDLGVDVVARFAKGRVLPVDPFSAVLALFSAKVLDPTLVRDARWMLDDLIALAPAGGWPDQPVAGVLDADLAWRVWHEAQLGCPIPDDLDAIFALGSDPKAAVALSDLDDTRRQAVAGRWLGGLEPAPLMIKLIIDGRGSELEALGIVADVLWSTTDDAAMAEQQRLGRARLESTFGRDRLDNRAAGRWSAAVRARLDGSERSVAVLDHAERLLDDADVAQVAVLSDDLVRGFEHRMTALAAAVGSGDLERSVTALEHIKQHNLARSFRSRLKKAEAAVRLVRRAARPSSLGAPSGFPALAADYAHEWSWVDEIRLLLADGDPLPEVASVYSRLCAELDGERRSGDVTFAQALAEWSVSAPIDDPRIVPVEQILDNVVARVAADAPVLLIVADGVGLPVAHQLLTSLAEHGWARATPDGATEWPAGIAMLPTVTEVSRTSLLTGERREGGQAEELDGFAQHPALRRVSQPDRAPVLFHKGRLSGASGYSLSDEVQRAVSDPDQRVVGVVLNAVDDHLAKGQQIKVNWDVETMGPLAALLEAARDGGRVIVLTADHGHVIHGEGALMRRHDGDTGERWRPVGTPPSEDEVEVAGPRVLKGGRVILPADDRIRYAGHKHGYHGGACPHEVIVPVEVIARSLPAGWVHRPLPRPDWWAPKPSAAPEPAVPTPAPALKTESQPSLFEPEAPVPPPVTAAVHDAIADLLQSSIFVSQRERNPRARAIDDARVATYLRPVVDQGGTMPLAALADQIGEPADQLRMSLMVVRRLLNFDGTEVLGISATGDIELNIDLLRLQFDLA